MKHLLLLVLSVLLLTASGCSPATITTRQNVSAEDISNSVKLEIVSSPKRIIRGEMAEVTVKGEPNRLCSIAVHLSSGVSKAKGLEPCETDANGIAVWTWKVSKQTKPGEYRITVTCGDQLVDTYFTIE